MGLSPRGTMKGKEPGTPDTYASSDVSMKSARTPVSGSSPYPQRKMSPVKRSFDEYEDREDNDDNRKMKHKLPVMEVNWFDVNDLADYIKKLHPSDALLLNTLSHIDLIEYACADYSPSDLKMLTVYLGTTLRITFKKLNLDGQSKKNLTIQIVEMLTEYYSTRAGDTRS